MTRVLHTGDTHIGYQQYHSPERRADFLAAFEQVIDDAVEMDVDAVVHAGDLFHDRRPDLPDLMGTLSALRDLDAADIPFLAVVGNHESTRGGQWLDLFERLGLATRLGDDPVAIDSVAFYGLDHVPESRRDDLDYDFTLSADSDLDAEPTHSVLVGHGLFTPFAHANWNTETVLDESTTEFDAVLLGDNHAPGIEQVDDVWVTYCGSTERASASEEDERGYNVVGFDADDPGPAGVDIRRRSLSDATREFVFVTVDLEPGEGAERVREKIGQHDLAEAVVIVEITGDGDPVTPGEIESLALDNGALIARVTDRREIETETELSVSFADPDAAVDERIEELGLSAAALDIDEAVRSPDIADSNLRETVKSRLKEQIENDPAALAPPERDDGDASEVAAESDSESDMAADSPDDNAADAETESDDTAAADSTDDESSADDGTTADEDTADDEGDTAEGELSTMEDFL